MISDVQDILDVPSTATEQPLTKEALLSSDSKKKSKKIDTNVKRPEGMHREVYNLLVGDKKDVPPLIPTETAVKMGGYKNVKARLGLRKVRPWHNGPFTNPARQDDLQLSHWRRVEDEEKEYPFARFNKILEIQQFTHDDYAKYLTSSTWTEAETEHLFELCKRFDLRWPVVCDRFDNEIFSKKRSIEDLKERFYEVCNKLIQVRTPEGEELKLLHFDAEHERHRKEQLEKLWNRTDEQIEEEEFLLQELRRIEARKKERAKKAQDLQKLISAADRSPSTPATPSAQSTAPKKKFYKGPTALASTSESFNLEATSGLKFPELKGAGVHLRSHRMKLPPTLGQKKVKAIDVALEKLGLEYHPVATDEIVGQFNELRSDIMLLYELKSALSNCEFELETLKHQYQSQTGTELPIPAHLRVTQDSTSVDSTSPFKRRIADALEVTVGPAPQVGRKKKVQTIDQAALIKKMRKL